MKKIIIITLVSLMIILSGCGDLFYKSKWSKSSSICNSCENNCDSVEVGDEIYYKCKDKEESGTKNCAELTFEEFDISNEDQEAKELVYLMQQTSYGNDIRDDLSNVSNKTLEAYVHHLECMGFK